MSHVDDGTNDITNQTSLFGYWNSTLVSLENVGTVEIFSHGGGGTSNMYKTNYFVSNWAEDGYGRLLDLKWTDDMNIANSNNNRKKNSL